MAPTRSANFFSQPVRMIVSLDRDEDRDAKSELVLVDDGDPLLDHALAFELLDPLPARRRGQADAVADLGDRQRRILLQHGEYLAVDGIHSADPDPER